jgi:hypothetical protein
MDTVSFSVRPSSAADEKTYEIVSSVNGRELSDLVTEFERAASFDVAGGYGGIIPAYFNFGSLLTYYQGAREDWYWGEVGKIALLGCGSCGEVGCWPLCADVQLGDVDVSWSAFEQPHRSGRNYGGFGPFLFERMAYDGAVRRAVERYERDEPT